jgi:hypothetical protein
VDDTLKTKILELLEEHRLLTVATNRPDGWPQATTVGYVNDGLTIYFLCSPQSQKAANLAGDSRVSLTIDHDVSDPMAITGLSMAALAEPVTDTTEVAGTMNLLGTHPRFGPPPSMDHHRQGRPLVTVRDLSKSHPFVVSLCLDKEGALR